MRWGSKGVLFHVVAAKIFFFCSGIEDQEPVSLRFFASAMICLCFDLGELFFNGFEAGIAISLICLRFLRMPAYFHMSSWISLWSFLRECFCEFLGRIFRRLIVKTEVILSFQLLVI